MTHAALLVLAFLALALAPAPAAAGLYKCTDAAGRVSYTGDPHDCPGRSEQHETRREIQDSGTPTPPAARATRTRRPRPTLADTVSRDEAAAAMWEGKRTQAEAALRQVEASLPRWERLQTNCNRGADAWTTDEAGVKHKVTCEQISSALERAEAERTRLRAYLGGGLEEECRRAGCLPGWIR